MIYDPKIINDYIKSIDYYNFQDFCDRLLLKLYPKDYTPVRAGGRNGDMKNDGYCYISRIFFQAHATRGESSSKTKEKIKFDLLGCLKHWNNVKKFIYITNDTLLGEVEKFVDDLRIKHPNIIIETWGFKKLTMEIQKLEIHEIEFVIDRKIIPEINILENELISAKFLITNEFSLIKELSQSILTNFPFENPYLLENETLKFLRLLISNQDYRENGFPNSLNITREEYEKKYPDSVNMPFKKEEYQFFYHERTPRADEIKNILKNDNISKFLLNNNTPLENISKIKTCYEDACSGNDEKLQELYLLRPLYVQFIIIKNISNIHIRLNSIESNFYNGVLYEIENSPYINRMINIPNFIIEPKQNLVIPIGLFLSKFGGIKNLDNNIVSSIYMPDQIQELKLCNLEENKIEYIGPCFSPKEISGRIGEKTFSSKIHDFSFNEIYWIERNWLCGSCPHLFFVINGKIKYQGEIFNVSPNQLHTVSIQIPDGVDKLIIAELEQEITKINKILINKTLIETNISMAENDFYCLKVTPFDTVEIEGKYILNSDSYRKLSKYKKLEIINRFKKNYDNKGVYPK